VSTTDPPPALSASPKRLGTAPLSHVRTTKTSASGSHASCSYPNNEVWTPIAPDRLVVFQDGAPLDGI